MTCELWQDKMSAYADAELLADEQAGMDSHVAACQACAAELLTELRLKQATRLSGRAFAAPAALRARVLAPAARRRSWFGAMMPLVAAAAVVAIAFLLLPRRSADRTIAELVDLHTTTLASANPVDVISTDRHTVKPWFEGRLPFSFNLPELAGTPFELIGGKLVYFRQSPGAELVYRYQQHRLSVFVFLDSPDWPLPPGGGNFQFASWTNRGLRFVVIGDTGMDVIGRLASLFKSAS